MPKINVQDEIAELKAKIRLYPLLGVAAGIMIGFILRSLF